MRYQTMIDREFDPLNFAENGACFVLKNQNKVSFQRLVFIFYFLFLTIFCRDITFSEGSDHLICGSSNFMVLEYGEIMVKEMYILYEIIQHSCISSKAASGRSLSCVQGPPLCEDSGHKF